MKIKTNINPKDFSIGVIVARFQVSKLTDGHRNLIDDVCQNHKKVIIFLGVDNKTPDESDPMDFATVRAMVQEAYPNIIILPLRDIRDDDKWSQLLDAQISLPFDDLPAVLYGSRDSFLSHYKGKHAHIEFIPDLPVNGTEHRKEVASTVRTTEDFRAGIIYSVHAQRPVTYPTVDVVAYNEKKQILLAKKPNEKLFRFIGGFVDRTDPSYDVAAKREFAEETGGSEIDALEYITSGQIKDWRYAKSRSGIMTTLFAGKFIFGKANPTDDIEFLEWKNPFKIDVETEIMPEHRDLYKKLLTRLPAIFKSMETQQ